jgi:hypothetical protein
MSAPTDKATSSARRVMHDQANHYSSLVDLAKEFDDFAKAVVADWMIANGYPTGHGDTLDDLLRELVALVRKGWNINL